MQTHFISKDNKLKVLNHVGQHYRVGIFLAIVDRAQKGQRKKNDKYDHIKNE